MASEKKCCVPGCIPNSESRTTLHSFPNPEKDIDRFMLWVSNIGGDIKKLNNEYIYKYRRVCHAHFELKYCCRYSRLSNIAVPTLNCPELSTTDSNTTSIEPLKSIETVSNILPSTSKACIDLHNADQDDYDDVLQDVSVDDEIISIPPVPMEKENIACQLLSPENTPGPIEIKICFIPENKTSSEVYHKEPIQIIEVEKPNKKFLKSNMTETERELYKKLVETRMKLSKCRNKYKKQTVVLKNTKKLLFTNNKFVKALENMPTERRLLTLMQLRENRKKGKGRRFSEEEKKLSLSILKQSPSTYKFLRKILILPSLQTLV